MAGYFNQWRIELCERPVKKGRGVDYILFGRGLSHPFLALIDDKGIVRGELHGVPHDPASIDRKSRLSAIFEYSATFTTPIGVDLIVRDAIAMTPLAKAFPILRSRHYDKARQYPEARVRRPLMQSHQSLVQATWNQMRAAAARFDGMNMDYNRFGWGKGRYNCQTMIAGILHEVNLATPLSQVYAAPGWKKPAANVDSPVMRSRKRAGQHHSVNP